MSFVSSFDLKRVCDKMNIIIIAQLRIGINMYALKHDLTQSLCRNGSDLPCWYS
jgi:hypothetical protein